MVIDFFHIACVCAQTCPTLCDPVDCSLPGSSAHGILQARTLEWVAIPFYRGSSPKSVIELRSPALQADSLPFLHLDKGIEWLSVETAGKNNCRAMKTTTKRQRFCGKLREFRGENTHNFGACWFTACLEEWTRQEWRNSSERLHPAPPAESRS